ncbi:hypothetical protein [Carboxylicivirga sp. M1479]|uniref:hypothetical protein n=1 Tax=Carboxylicivirga sp. M1479 TaxID=2594476 RepID=UPI0011782646|nr:hypothetical protein [Carboxylicivirga sp. M1479]TRX70530.1 hypothetical protein FNN09_11165 [Carboxylicivirga sp. M1479]
MKEIRLAKEDLTAQFYKMNGLQFSNVFGVVLSYYKDSRNRDKFKLEWYGVLKNEMFIQMNQLSVKSVNITDKTIELVVFTNLYKYLKDASEVMNYIKTLP